MKNNKRIFLVILTVIMLFNMSFTSFADYVNAVGGGGGTGIGTSANAWVVKNTAGADMYEAEGLRVYLLTKEGDLVPGSGVIDITNSPVSKTNMWNNLYSGRKQTKVDYREYINGNLKIYSNKFICNVKEYIYTIVDTPTKLPQIIPWGVSDSKARVQAIKDWFKNESETNTSGQTHCQWIFSELGVSEIAVRA